MFLTNYSITMYIFFFTIKGYINNILSWSALVPLSRLSYMAYLCHPIVILSFMMQSKYPFNYDDYNMVGLYWRK